MNSNEAKNEMLVGVLIDLAAICQKLAENSAVPEELRVKAGRETGRENSPILTKIARSPGPARGRTKGSNIRILPLVFHRQSGSFVS